MRRVAARAASAIGVLLAVFTVVFAILRLLPGDPVSLAAQSDSGGGQADPKAIAALRAQYGLDLPVWRQYLRALIDLLTGDWGTSVTTGQPVTEAFGEALAPTLALTAAALGIAIIVAGVLSYVATLRPASLVARFVEQLPPVLVSVPTFAVGLLLVQVFSFHWKALPAFGDRGAQALILPAVTLAFPLAGYLAQIFVAGIRDASALSFPDVVRAKGAGETRVHAGHVLRVALLPVFTAAAVLVGASLAGAVVVETVFSRNGVGRLTQQAVQAHDGPVVLVAVVASAAVFVVVNLVADLAAPLIDPRLRGHSEVIA